MIFAAAAVGMASVLTAGFQAPEAPSFNRYQPILQRMPFGPPPPDPGSMVTAVDTKSAAQDLKEQQLLARQINMSCVNITPSGKPAVGFTDLSSKPPVNYYILVGGDAGGWTLKSASYAEEWAELEKDGITIFVKLGQGLMADPPKALHQNLKTALKLNGSESNLTKREPDESQSHSDDQRRLSPDEHFTHMLAIELAGGPPSPIASTGDFNEEEMKAILHARREFLSAKRAGQSTTSYRERLNQINEAARIVKEEREKEIREELENIAVKIAQDEIKKQEAIITEKEKALMELNLP